MKEKQHETIQHGSKLCISFKGEMWDVYNQESFINGIHLFNVLSSLDPFAFFFFFLLLCDFIILLLHLRWIEWLALCWCLHWQKKRHEIKHHLLQYHLSTCPTISFYFDKNYWYRIDCLLLSFAINEINISNTFILLNELLLSNFQLWEYETEQAFKTKCLCQTDISINWVKCH